MLALLEEGEKAMLELMERPAQYLLEEVNDVLGPVVEPLQLKINPSQFSLSLRRLEGGIRAEVDVMPKGWMRGTKLVTRFLLCDDSWNPSQTKFVTFDAYCPRCGQRLRGVFSYGAPELLKPWRLAPLVENPRNFCCSFLPDVCTKHYRSLGSGH